MEVDVAGGVDEIQFELLPIKLVSQRHRAGLDSDSPIALDVQVVEDLVTEFTLGDGTSLQQQLVGQCALAVVDVCDDREIADAAGVHGGRHPSERIDMGRDDRR
ncbi:MAG: hypothetical protein CM1200mP2_54700 [Planctomycetaceae bacterium]|nr:MAG: hypothetical protein CM1200mP2_54700 [Planctomycetaceae bacterium]